MAGRAVSEWADAGGRLGRVITARRVAAGLTRQQLAQRVAMSVNTVMAIEQGRVADPGVFVTAALAAGMGVGLDDVLDQVRLTRSDPTRPLDRGLVSVGYQDCDLGEIIGTLTECGVGVVADVRLNPVSRRPGFSKRALSQALQGAGITYRHLRGLGNPRDNRAGFQRPGPSPARDSFRALLDTVPATTDLAELATLAADHVVAVLCFERDETLCHRQLIIHAVREQDLTVPVATVP